jgi:alkanesulfonate monooxygenase SsuD/methylene tetrahydromethanopterin reductase-like flavin-dependent oxidoreductase (luciferase family)
VWWPGDVITIDAWTALTYLADHSERLRFGPLVSPLSFRDPVNLARQAMDLDDLGGGRFVLGVGTGWNEREHATFGWPLGDAKTRTDRLAEGLAVITQLCRADAPVTYQGQFYHLHEATLLPHAPRPGGPAILLGSSGKPRTLSLAGRYADVVNTPRRSPEQLTEIYQQLDEHLAARGREPASVKRTVVSTLFVARDEDEMERRTRFHRTYLDPDHLTPQEFVGTRRARGVFIGTPQEVVDQLRAYAEVGVEEVMVDLLDLEDLEVMELIAKEVLPHV